MGWESLLHAFTWHAGNGKRYYTHLLGMLFMRNATTRIEMLFGMLFMLLHAFNAVNWNRYYTHSLGTWHAVLLGNATTRIHLA